MKKFLIGLGVALLIAQGFFAQSPGNQIIVNQTLAGEQTAPVLAADQFGNHLVVWISTPQDNGLPGVYGRWFNPDGTPQSAEFQINSYWAPHDQPSLAMGGLGSFVVVSENYWIEGPVSCAVTARIFNVNGQPLDDEFVVHQYTADFQGSPDVGMDGLGRFVVVWQSWGQDGDGFGIFGRLFDGNGAPLGPEFQVNSTSAGHQMQPAVAVEDQGDFMVVWTSDGQDGDSTGVYGQRFDRSGSFLGSEFRVNFISQGRQERPDIAKDVLGNFMVCWQRYLLDEEGYAVYARIFDRTTQLKGPEFQVHEASPGWQALPSVDSDSLGNFLIVWQSSSEGGSGFDIRARAFDGYGLPLGAAIRVSSAEPGRQQIPQALMLSPIQYFVCWQSRPAGEEDWNIAHRVFREAAARTLVPPRHSFTRHARKQNFIKHSPSGPAADIPGTGI
jgi:hypothetical protein